MSQSQFEKSMLRGLRTAAVLAVLFTGLASASSLTVNGSLSPQGSNNYCAYTGISEDAGGNWSVTCGAGPKTISFNPPLFGQTCNSYAAMSEGGSGNWTVSNCVSSAVPATVYYVHPDNLGTPRMITRPTDNAIVWRWDNNEPFGVGAANESVSGTTFKYNLRFPGQYYDWETGTHYNYFRDYDPSIGRYIESDPIGLGGGTNTYGYVLANPIAFADPLGLEACAGTWSRAHTTFDRLERIQYPTCSCYWLCMPCSGSVAWSGNALGLPKTTGMSFVSYSTGGNSLSIGTGGGAGRLTTNREGWGGGRGSLGAGAGGRGSAGAGGGGAAGGGLVCICPQPGPDGCFSCPVPRS